MNINIKEFHEKWNKSNIKSFRNVINKNNLLIIILFYIIGIIITLIRNRKEGIPYFFDNFIQYSIIATYFIIGLIICFGDYKLIEFILNIKIEKNYKNQIMKIFFVLVIQIIISIICGMMLKFLFINVTYLIAVFSVILFITAPILLVRLIKKEDRFILILFTNIIIVISIVLNIPIIMGGVKPINVIYKENASGDTYQLKYYGISNGIYIFKNGDVVFLRPIDSGSIQYKYNIKDY